MEFTAQKLSHHLFLGQHTAQPKTAVHDKRRRSQLTPEQWNDQDEKQNHHQHQLDENHLAKRLVKHANPKNKGATEGQLNPTGISDLAGHFVSDDYGAERIHSGGDGVEDQQRSQRPVVAQFEMSAKQRFPQKAGNHPQAEAQHRQDEKDQQQSCNQDRAVFTL